jgi:6-phosphogluconolactonase
VAAAGQHFSLALSGGRTPRRMLELLDPKALAGEGVTIYQVDERVAPDGDPDRNLTAIRAALSDAALEQLRPMPVLEEDLDLAASRYEDELPEHLDLVHLGLGPDGHTASLVPGDPVLEVRDRFVAVTTGEYQGRRRMTLTYPALDAARRVLWLVTGEDKRDALERLLSRDRSIPAGRVDAANAIVICDSAAR